MATITPTIGRVVWFHPEAPHGAQTWAGIVAYVHSPGMVNLAVFDANGHSVSKTSVPLIQDGDERPQSYYCEWMPYQKGQAAKTEALEAQIAAEGTSFAGART